MGIVESVEEHSTSIAFRINDGTGAIDAKLWNDKDVSGGFSAKAVSCRDNTFVKVVGSIREFEGRKHVLIFDITALNDWNELTHHLFQVMLAHLQHTKGPIPVSRIHDMT
jgi:replication factor A2